MKRILTFFLALTMVLSLAACGGKADDNKGKTEVTMTAQEIMDTLKEKLGDSFGCDVAETEDNISGYWGLDMTQVESWASMSNSNSAVNSSYAVIAFLHRDEKQPRRLHWKGQRKSQSTRPRSAPYCHQLRLML